jgi:5-methylcytosine-specific restriction endonuclease McrA
MKKKTTIKKITYRKAYWDYKSKRYVGWRTKVFKRDLYCCRICGSNGYIEAHHIRKKSKYPRLAFYVSNGVALCKKHHRAVTGSEDKWVDFFRKLVAGNNRDYKNISKEFNKCLKKLK